MTQFCHMAGEIQCKRKRHLENYLADTVRAVQVDRDLQRSLSSNKSSILSGGDDLTVEIMAKQEKRAVECSRGCPVVLKNLAKTFHSLGRHCWPTRMYQQNAYPSPVNSGSAETNKIKSVSNLIVLFFMLSIWQCVCVCVCVCICVCVHGSVIAIDYYSLLIHFFCC